MGKVSLFILFSIIPLLTLFWPRVSVYIGPALDSHAPFESTFIIKNEGNFPIYNLQYDLKLNDVKIRGVRFNNSTAGTPVAIMHLFQNESTTILINNLLKTNVPVDYAEIHIDITFKYFLIDIKNHFRFKMAKNISNEFFWLPYFNP